MHGLPLLQSKPNQLLPSSWIQRNASPRHCDQKFEDKSADCSRRHLTAVPQELRPDTHKLSLWMNDLSALYNTSFHRYPQLTELFLSGNQIRYIEGGTFYPLRHLTVLILSGNPNLEFSAEIFRWSTEVQELNLGDRTLKVFPSDTMKFLPSLVTLNLGESYLTTVNITMCNSVDNRSINLFRNEIKSITPEAFIFYCPADSLSILDNPIEDIDSETVASLPIRKFELGYMFFPEYVLEKESLKNLFQGVSLSQIEELWVENAGITTIAPDLFAPLRNKSLSKLSLSGNRLDLYPSVFADLKQVSALYLDNCHVERLEPSFFNGMTALRHLNLDYSLVKELNPSGSMWTINLQELHLSQNAFREINEFAFKGLHNLTTLVMNDINVLSLIPPTPTALHVFAEKIEIIANIWER